MTIATTPHTRHVRQVAELVKRLSGAELDQLIKLVPALQRPAKRATRTDIIQWARGDLARHASKIRSTRQADSFVGDKTVAEYLALPDKERERIWAELYAKAVAGAKERRVKPNAALPAR